MTSARSLNAYKKQEELKRIERENLKIAQKIFSMKPSIRATDHLKSFEYHQSISLGMRRIKKTKLEASELPPILDVERNKSNLDSYAPLTERGGEKTDEELLPSVKKAQAAPLTLPKRYASTKPTRNGA